MSIARDHLEDTEVESLRLELQRCQRELEVSSRRLERLENLFDCGADAIFVAELDGRLVEVNPAAWAMLGCTKAELLALHLWDLVRTPGSREELLGVFQGMLPSMPVTVRAACEAKGGQHLTVDLNLVRCSLGGSDLIVATCRDVTAHGAVMDVTAQRLTQQSLESALRDMRALKDEFGLAIDTIPGLVWSALPDGYIDFLNQRWRDYTGLSLAEASGWGWRAAIHPQDLPGLESYWRSVIASGKPGETEARLRRSDGAYRWFLFRAVPLTDGAGKLVKWYGQTTDIDDLKRTEERLRHSEAFLTEAQRLSLTGSFGWNVATGALVWSAETFCILGYEPSINPTLEMVLQRVHPEDRDFVQHTLDRAQREDSDFELEHRLMMPDGSIKHVRVMARATKAADDTIDFVGAVMDITQLSQAAQALRISEHLARGQLEALTKSLAALSKESKPEKFLEHVLCMMCERLAAHSVGAWVMNDASRYFELVANYEDGRLHLPTPEEIHVNPHTQTAERDHPVWSAFLRGEIGIAYGAIDPGTAKVHVARDPNGPWYDNAGRPAANPIVPKICEHPAAQGIVATICVPMLVAGKVIGFFSMRFKVRRHLRQEEIELTQAMAHQATLAIRLMRLAQQSREAAVIAERIRMARDIHDTLAQGFTGVIVQLEAAKGAIAKQNFSDVRKRMERASDLARSSLLEARRSVLALRPKSLQGGTLTRALKDLLKQMTDGARLHAAFEVSGEERAIPMEWEENLLRITQEALTNTVKHAQAQNFRAILHYGPGDIQLQLIDDGRGFDLGVEHDGFGLIGMKERVGGMSGRFTIRSSTTEGTEIRIIVSNPPGN